MSKYKFGSLTAQQTQLPAFGEDWVQRGTGDWVSPMGDVLNDTDYRDKVNLSYGKVGKELTAVPGLGVPPSAGTDLGFNTETLGVATGLGQLALGAMNYKDASKANRQALRESKFNLSQAKEDAAINRAYRASYGLV